MMPRRLRFPVRLPLLAALAVLIAVPAAAPAVADDDEIGCVSTVFKLVGPNHKICIDAFDDPEIPGVTCHISRAKTGGLKGMVGLAEDKSDAAIACRQVGPITLPDDLDDGEEVFEERRSILFKRLRVVRFYDEKRKVLAYLVYSDKLIDGSPKNSISTVPILADHVFEGR